MSWYRGLVGEAAADRLGLRRDDRAVGEEAFDGFFEIVRGGRRPLDAERDETVIDAAAVKEISFGIEQGRFRSDGSFAPGGKLPLNVD